MDSAIAALVGAAIGALGSFGGLWIQQRHQSRRERAKLASELGMLDFRIAREHVLSRGGVMAPLSAYVMYHSEFLEALASGPVTPDLIEKMNERQRALFDAFPDPERKSK